jgi:hypothetical protein
MKRPIGRHAKFLFCNLGRQEPNGADDILDCRCHGTRFKPSQKCYLIFVLSLPVLRATQPVFWGKSDDKERWIELCEQAAVEHDANKLLKLIQEIDKLLREKQERMDSAKLQAH